MKRESRIFSLTRTLTTSLLALTMLAFSASARRDRSAPSWAAAPITSPPWIQT